MTIPRRDIEAFTLDAVPAALSFSSAIRADDVVYISGQIGHVPGEMRLVDGGLEAEARQALDYLGESLAMAGSSFARVIKCTVFFADMKDFKVFNDIYRTYFSNPLPARSGIEVQGLALGACIEIECIALTD